jgi:hypothetical protein
MLRFSRTVRPKRSTKARFELNGLMRAEADRAKISLIILLHVRNTIFAD